jgi:hypothetical protein
MDVCRNSSKRAQKLNFQPVLNIELFPTLMELELGMLGTAIELMKDAGHLWRWNFWKNNFLSLHRLPKEKTITFSF